MNGKSIFNANINIKCYWDFYIISISSLYSRSKNKCSVHNHSILQLNRFQQALTMFLCTKYDLEDGDGK